MKLKKTVVGFLAAQALAVLISYASMFVPTLTPKAEAKNPSKESICVVTLSDGSSYTGCTTCPAGLNCAACQNSDPCP